MSPGSGSSDSDFDRDARRLQEPSGLENPYPLYHRLRSRRPVGWSSTFGGCWLVTSYPLVTEALRSDATLSMEQGLAPKVEFRPEIADEYKAFANFVSHSMLVRDGKPHRRLRSMVTRAFTQSAMQRKEARVRELVEALLAPLADRRQVDLAAELSLPLPIAVIAEIVGLPEDDLGRLRHWADDMTVFLGGGPDPQAALPAALASCLAMTRYFEQQVERLRRSPADGLLSELLAAQANGESFKDKEICAQCMLLFIAGHQTTSDLISTTVHGLLEHPELVRRLREEPELIPDAIEECLRYDGPVQLAGRLANADFELGGERIAAGQRVILVLGAANRDPDRFPEPDRLLVPRPDNRHLAFGAGPHQCPGARLGRLEGRVALETLLRRMPGLRPGDAPPVRELNAGFRRITSLPVAWG